MLQRHKVKPYAENFFSKPNISGYTPLSRNVRYSKGRRIFSKDVTRTV